RGHGAGGWGTRRPARPRRTGVAGRARREELPGRSASLTSIGRSPHPVNRRFRAFSRREMPAWSSNSDVGRVPVFAPVVDEAVAHLGDAHSAPFDPLAVRSSDRDPPLREDGIPRGSDVQKLERERTPRRERLPDERREPRAVERLGMRGRDESHVLRPEREVRVHVTREPSAAAPVEQRHRLPPVRRGGALAWRGGARRRASGAARTIPMRSALIPRGEDEVVVALGDRRVKLTNPRKPFWPELGITKGDLVRYYLAVAPVLLPHIRDRAMVMRRYPNGASGESFFMKRAPTPRPDWIAICPIEHASGNIIDFPMIQDIASLLWVVNLGCIDLNQWYARCDDVDRPDYLHFDLDPGQGVAFERVVEAALILHRVLDDLGMPSYAKTTGSKGMHVYVPIEPGPPQKRGGPVPKTIA